jgi:hypothetical protein
MPSRSAVAFPLLLLAVTACHDDHHDHVVVQPPEPRPVSILVEVYDPATNLVWQDVSVRIVEADQEWSGCTCVSPYVDWYLTDANGRVFLDEYLIAAAQVGFVEDDNGRAQLRPESWGDEALVVLEIDALGFTSRIVEVPLRWDTPDVFVEVPFQPDP